MTFERREKSERNDFNVWQKGHPFKDFLWSKKLTILFLLFCLYHCRQQSQDFLIATILPLSIEKIKPLPILEVHFLNFHEAYY
jgi:hypothetical protein